MATFQFRGWVGLTPELQDDIRELLGKSGLRERRLIGVASIDDEGAYVPSLTGDNTRFFVATGVNHRDDSIIHTGDIVYTQTVGAILLRIHAAYPSFKIALLDADMLELEVSRNYYRQVFREDAPSFNSAR